VKEMQRLEAGCSALYTWQDPTGKRELVWSCPDKDKDFKDELIKVLLINYVVKLGILWTDNLGM